MSRHLAFTAAFLIGTFPALAQDGTQGHMHTMNHAAMMNEGLPQETGQSAFAAIQEIVSKLEKDPKTDWSKVNIEALRQHLIDMNNVTLLATVEATQVGNALAFKVTGDGPVIASIQRMVLAHSKTMNGVDGWTYLAEANETGATLTVTPPDASAMDKLKGLGFIGIMTVGMHHQAHHWMIATGLDPHG